MLDGKFIVQNRDAVKQNCINRGVDPTLVDRFVGLEIRRQSLQIELEQLQKKQNEISREIRESVVLVTVE